MLNQLGSLTQLLRNAGRIRQNMEEMNARLTAARYVGQSAGGQVQATVDGRGEVVALKIEPALVRAGDVELLEELVCAALRDAVRLSREGAQKELEQAAGGLNLQGMMDMLGK